MRFLGGARTVTGSKYLLDTSSARVLVECGLFQGLKELRLRNWAGLDVPPSSLDAIVVSHAHLDHSGYIPKVVRDGFAGPVYATPNTRRLCAIVLPDSGRLHEEEAEYANRKGYSKHRPALPLYTEEDARRSLRLFRDVEFHHPHEVADGVVVEFGHAGHILGSASITVRLDGVGVFHFSGDLGRPGHPILRPPQRPPVAAALAVESTYGDRRHPADEELDTFEEVIIRTAERRGFVVIPSFAVDRTELVLMFLKERMERGRVPAMPVYLDSPMAIDALRLYEEAVFHGDPEIRRELHGRRGLFNPGRLFPTRTVAESKRINHAEPPAVIIAGSGMATGGRVLHHLARRLPDPRNAVVLVGYQAEGTRGRALLEGARKVKMLGRYVPVRAEVVNVSAFSAHADHDELLDWVEKTPEEPDVVYVVHGEMPAASRLAASIEERLGWIAVVPRPGEVVRLDRL